MARARNIKPSFFQNEDVVELDFGDRLLFIGLWTLADREGRLEDRPKRIKMTLFPADEFDVQRGISELVRYGFVLRYEVAGKQYIQILNFTRHQKPHHQEKASEIPPPPNLRSESEINGPNPSDSLNTDSLSKGETGSPEDTKRFKPPTVDEIRSYCEERGNGLDAEKIHSHYTASNWYRGKTKIKDWKACVRTWEKTAEAGSGPSSDYKTLMQTGAMI